MKHKTSSYVVYLHLTQAEPLSNAVTSSRIIQEVHFTFNFSQITSESNQTVYIVNLSLHQTSKAVGVSNNLFERQMYMIYD